MAEQRMPATLAELLAQMQEAGIPSSDYAIHVRQFLDFKAREQGVPYSGKFELTPLCNLDCKMCYVHLNREQMRGASLLEAETWKSLMTQAAEMGMMEALLTGGECLTYPQFDELYLHLHDLGVETAVYTNGVLLNEKRIAFFKKHPAHSIQVSLYGSNEDAYERVTGHRSFGVVYRNLMAAKEAGLPVRLAITPCTYMLEDAENVIRLAHEIGFPSLINWSLFDPREETGRNGQRMDISVDDYVSLYKLHYQLSGLTVKSVDPVSLPDVGGTDKSIGQGLRCGAGRSSFSIGYDGAMRPCGMLRHITQHPLQSGFASAWKQINAAAESYPVPMTCLDCQYRSECPICPVHHEQAAAQGHTSPIICARAKRMAAEGLFQLPC